MMKLVPFKVLDICTCHSQKSRFNICAGLIALCFSTQGGAHVFEILQSYIADWPLLLFTVLTMVSSVHCLSMSSIIKFISIMTRHKLTNYSKSHLSVILVTVAPILVTVRKPSTLHFQQQISLDCKRQLLKLIEHEA